MCPFHGPQHAADIVVLRQDSLWISKLRRKTGPRDVHPTMIANVSSVRDRLGSAATLGPGEKNRKDQNEKNYAEPDHLFHGTTVFRKA